MQDLAKVRESMSKYAKVHKVCQIIQKGRKIQEEFAQVNTNLQNYAKIIKSIANYSANIKNNE